MTAAGNSVEREDLHTLPQAVKREEGEVYPPTDGGEDMFASYTLPTVEKYVTAADGQPVHALRVGTHSSPAVIICHGFGGNKNIRNLVRLAETLAEIYAVYTFDFRGHGLSPGRCTFGLMEILDLEAVRELAVSSGARRVAALGFSMGGVVVIRYAALRGGLDSVIAVSVPADLRKAEAPGAKLIRLLLGNPLGRVFTAMRYGVKVDRDWKLQAPPLALVPLVAPQPLTVIQGEDDYIFEVEQARELARRGGPSCRLVTFPSFGHAEQGYGPDFVRCILETLQKDLDHPRGG